MSNRDISTYDTSTAEPVCINNESIGHAVSSVLNIRPQGMPDTGLTANILWDSKYAPHCIGDIESVSAKSPLQYYRSISLHSRAPIISAPGISDNASALATSISARLHSRFLIRGYSRNSSLALILFSILTTCPIECFGWNDINM